MICGTLYLRYAIYVQSFSIYFKANNMIENTQNSDKLQHNTLEYRLFFYKIFKNSAANGENAQSIQSLNRTTLPAAVLDPTPLQINGLWIIQYDFRNWKVLVLEEKIGKSAELLNEKELNQ